MNAKTLTLIKKVAAILLLVCFVLPLSRCTTKAEIGAENAVKETHLYAYELAGAAWNDVKANEAGGLSALFAVLNVFFVPAICLALRDRLQAAIYFFASFVSAYFLYCWVFVFSTRAEIGGIIATSCWMLLFGISCVTLWKLYRLGSLFKWGHKG